MTPKMRHTIWTLMCVLTLALPAAGQNAAPLTPLEEAAAKVEPAVGALYTLVNVTDEKGELVKNYYLTGGTLTVIASSDSAACLATAAHTTFEKDEVVKVETETIEVEDPVTKVKTKVARKLTHRFSNRYFVSFDGKNMFGIVLVAKRGDFPQPDDFAVFRVDTNGKLPKVELGDEQMVRLGTEVFSISSPAIVPGGLIATLTKGYVARHIDRNFPTTGSGLPQVRKLFILDIRMTHGSSGALVYVIRGNTAYAFSIFQGYFVAGSASQQVGDIFAYALGISAFKKFLSEDKVIERCLEQQ